MLNKLRKRLFRVRITHIQLAIRSMMNAVIKTGRCSKRDLDEMKIEDQLGMNPIHLIQQHKSVIFILYTFFCLRFDWGAHTSPLVNNKHSQENGVREILSAANCQSTERLTSLYLNLAPPSTLASGQKWFIHCFNENLTSLCCTMWF